MQLKTIVSKLNVLGTEGSLEREITGITYDSRRVTPGMVFVAVPGQNTDGHDFINSAIDRGAAAVICERNGFVTQRSTKVKVADAREAVTVLPLQVEATGAVNWVLQKVRVSVKGQRSEHPAVRHLGARPKLQAKVARQVR